MTVTFACVRTGSKYGPEYVMRLRNMIARHYRGMFRFLCLTDQPQEGIGVQTLDIRTLTNCEWAKIWWAKMLLFAPGCRNEERTIYLDLDTVVVGGLAPLVEWSGEFGICQNFITIAGHPSWCKYGSCAMSFAPGWGQDVFDLFMADRERFMREARHGDQSVIETLVPNATYLQDVLPPGFFLHYRDLPKYPDAPPPEASVMVFGGKERPDNCKIDWVRREWV